MSYPLGPQKASRDAFLSNDEKLLDWLCGMSSSTDVNAKLKCQAQSHPLSLERYEVHFYLQIMQLLLHNFHAAHIAIQSRSLSVAIAKQLISELSNVLRIESSSDKNATDFYQQVTQSANSIEVGLPSLPRRSASRRQRQIITFSELLLQQPLEHQFQICAQSANYSIFNERY